MQNGVILLNKRFGERSTRCVSKIKSLVGRGLKIGHAGTLDSTAEGLLVILLGSMTRTSSFIMELPKIYEVKAHLGYETDTLDSSGVIVKESCAEHITRKDVEVSLASMLGWINQVPPKISAVRIEGKRSHELARKGVDISPAPKPVRVYKIEVCDFDLTEKSISLRIRCGKGTYIRSIIRDLGRALGCYATVTSLRRTYVGLMDLQDSVSLEQLQMGSVDKYLLKPYEILKNYTIYYIPEDLQRWIKAGNRVEPSKLVRRSWSPFGIGRHVVLVGRDFFSFAERMYISGKPLFKPVRTIMCSEEELRKEDIK